MDFSILILLLFVLAAVVALVVLSKKKKQAKAEIDEKPKALIIENIESGGMLTLKGVGPDFLDVDCIVSEKHLYSEGSTEWYELECENGAEKLWLDLQDDGGLSLALKKGVLTDIAITEVQLDEFDTNEAGAFSYDGLNYEYEASGQAQYYEKCNRSNGENFYYWEFVAEGKAISVVRWGRSDYEVYFSESLNAVQVEIFSLKGNA